ncbi:MAG: PepSY domain-containing protein [Pseudomonadota bacterium]|nr:PepSY domain-containing protein [Pseudomonadota bacterium]
MNIKSLIVVAGLAIPFAANAAETLPKDAMTISEVASKLEAQGYQNITEISWDDGVWEAEAVKGDTEYEIKLSATDGKILHEKEDKW